MKKTIKSYSITLLFILLSTFLSAILLTTLKQTNAISYKTANITTNILSLSLFFISAIILGLKQKNKGLINGFFLSLIYISVSLIIGVPLNTFKEIMRFISKIILILCGVVIGVNIKKE